MKKLTLILMLPVLFLFCNCSNGKVMNPGFEKKLKNWNVDIWTDGGFVSTGYKNSERTNRILIIEAEEFVNDISVWQKIPAEPDTCYMLSAKILTENTPVDKTGATIGLYKTFFVQGDANTAADWQEVKLYFRTGKNKTSVNICCRLGIFGAPATGTAYFDDIALSKIPAGSGLYKSLASDNFASLILIDNASQPDDADDTGSSLLPQLFTPAGIVILILMAIVIALTVLLLILFKKPIAGCAQRSFRKIFNIKTAQFFFSPFREKLLHSSMIALAFSIILFWFGCINIFLNNIDEFHFILDDLYLPALMATLLASGIIIFILMITPYRFFRSVAIAFTAICMLLWIEWTIFSVYRLGMLSGESINWTSRWQFGVLDIALWCLLITLAVFLRKHIYRRLGIICISFIAFLLLAIGLQCLSFAGMHKDLTFNGKTEYEVDMSMQYDFSPEMNVIMIVVDETQSDVFYELQEKEKFNAMLDGFTYYPDAAAGLAYTEGAIPLILTGKYYDNQVPHSQYITDAYSHDSIPKVFADNNFRVELYPRFSASTVLYNKGIMANLKKRSAHFALKNLYTLVDISLFRVSPYFFKGGIYNNNKWLLSCKPETDQEQFDETNIDYSLLHDDDYYFVRNMKDEITAASQLPVFKFIHLFGCHAPFNKTRHGEYVDPESTRFIYREYMVYKMNLVGKILHTLKKKGLYDNSIIIILGDHGSGRGYQTNVDTNLIGLTPDENEQIIPTGVKGRGVPLFMVKDANARGLMRIDNRPVDYSKIKDMLFTLVQKQRQFNRGKDDVKSEESSTRKYLFYEYHDFNTTYLPLLHEFHINGNSWLDSSWSGPYAIYEKEKKYVLSREINFGQDGNVPEKDKQNFRTTRYNYDWLDGKSNSTLIVKNVSFSDEWLFYIRLHRPESSKSKTLTIMVNNKKHFYWEFEEDYFDQGAVLYNTFAFSASDIVNDTLKIDFHHQGFTEALGIKCIQLYSRAE